VEVEAACHVHSSWSYDAKWPIEALASTFRQRGCRVLMMTEHDRGFNDERYAHFRETCERVTTPDLYVLPGIEYSDPDNRLHVLTWGPMPFLGEGLDTSTLLKRVSEHGGAAVLAHPGRKRAWEAFQDEWIGHLAGIELWNRKYDGWAPSESAALLLARGSAVPFVGLDFHAANQLFPLTMSLRLDGEVSESAILRCIKDGTCSARAFDRPLDDPSTIRKLPWLRAAEAGRRRLAAVKRYAQGRT
jgi:hypothetical protein